MTDVLKPDFCVIGGGVGGLAVAIAAARFGAKVVLAEKGAMGGDNLNCGSVPSKALLAAARQAHRIRSSKGFGITPAAPVVMHRAVHDHVQSVIASIAPNDSPERLAGLGIQVIRAWARFESKDTVTAGDYQIKARRFVIATGSSPAIPALPGLEKVGYFTNENIFSLSARLDHLVVLGAGPVGLELAQAYLRLGNRVTVLDTDRVLPAEDPELVRPLLARLREEGLVIAEGAKVESIEPREGSGLRLRVLVDGRSEVVEGSHLLVANGRKPNVEGLGLEHAGIRTDRRGIKVGRDLRTSNRRAYAIGDVTGGPQYAHIAEYHAGIVIRQSLFGVPARVNLRIVPHVTFTEPEIAHVGLSEEEARKAYRGMVRVLRWPYSENDRAQAERRSEGFAKVITTPTGRILGAGIVGDGAGELIQTWALAAASRLNIKAMTAFVSPYPTLSEVSTRAAAGFFLEKLTSPFVRRMVRLYARLS